jgi:uncharacterized protein YndB with AHSA1/START domain
MRRIFLTVIVYRDLLERPTKYVDEGGIQMKAEMILAAVLSFMAVASTSPVAMAESANHATKTTTAEKALVIEVTVPAPVGEVWKAFTTSDGLSTWLTPNAVVDLREGGEWTAKFPGGSTGGGTILSFVPEKELVISALAPDKFPTVRATRTRARFSFEARGDSTVVRLTQTGWKEGDEWVKAYEYLTVGNAQLLATLHHRFVNGPIDWTK